MNERPFFVRDDEFDPMLWQIERGDGLEIRLPEIDDYDSDDVKISVVLSDDQ